MEKELLEFLKAMAKKDIKFNLSFVDSTNKTFDILGDNAKLFTDNNYSLQATNQRGSTVTIIDISSHNRPL